MVLVLRHSNENHSNLTELLFPVADPDLQIRGGGPGNTDPEIWRGAGLRKLFSALRASVLSKNNGEPVPPGPFPGSANDFWKKIGTKTKR